MIGVGLGEAATGLKMIWSGITWLIRSRQAPWSAVPISAAIGAHIPPWYWVRLFCLNDRLVPIEILRIKTVRPKRLPLRRPDPAFGSNAMIAESEGETLEGITWTIPARGQVLVGWERTVFVNLASLKGDVQIDLQIDCRLLDNRRTEFPVLVRTNKIALN